MRFFIADLSESTLKRRINFAMALALFVSLTGLSLHVLTDRGGWRAVIRYKQMFADGWAVTLEISFCSLFLSIFLGIILAALRRSSFLFLHYLGRIYVELVRGTPLLVQILCLYYGSSINSA